MLLGEVFQCFFQGNNNTDAFSFTSGEAEFRSDPYLEEVEITGHPSVHLAVSVAPKDDGPEPSDMDIFATIRHYDHTGQESKLFLSEGASDFNIRKSTTPGQLVNPFLSSKAGFESLYAR